MRSKWSRLERLLMAAAIVLAAIVLYHLSRNIYGRYQRSRVQPATATVESDAAESSQGGRSGSEAVTFLPPILINKVGRRASNPNSKAPPSPASKRSPQH